MSTDREQLIEAAAKALFADKSTDRLNLSTAPETWALCEQFARVAFAVFEKAHTPTDDEREALLNAAEAEAQDLLRAGQGRTGREVSAGRTIRWLVAGFRRTVQGEPSDAQVTAAMVAYEGHATRVEAWRAALRAAGVVSVQGEPERE